MKTRLMLLVLLGLLALGSCAMPKPNPKPPPPLPEGPFKVTPPAYYIVPEDVIEIQVWQNADLSRDAIVRPDGKIAMPLVGDLLAMGLTLTQLDEELTKQLSEYIRAPDVSVAVKKFGGEKIFILGAVASPGVHKFRGFTRLVEAIGMAKGCTRAARLEQVLVIRGDINKKPEVIVINYEDIIKKGDQSKNITIQSNDIIYVPSTFISDVAHFLRNNLAPVLSTIVTLDYFRARLKD